LYSGAPGHGIKNLTLYSSGLPLFIAPWFHLIILPLRRKEI
jgi:hypothetical protein